MGRRNAIDEGYLSPYFITDTGKMECILDDPYILIHEKKISSAKDLIPVLEKVVQAGKSLLIICEDVDGEALATLVVNRLRGTFQCCAVEAPGFGVRRKAIMEDIAILSGGKAIFESLGIKLESVTLEDLGPRTHKAIIGKDNTTLIQGGGKSEEIQARISQIRTDRKKSISDYDREKLDERIAKLTGGVTKINVGAATESELKKSFSTKMQSMRPRQRLMKASFPAVALHYCVLRKPAGQSRSCRKTSRLVTTLYQSMPMAAHLYRGKRRTRWKSDLREGRRTLGQLWLQRHDRHVRGSPGLRCDRSYKSRPQ